MAMPICLRLLRHEVRRAASRAACTAGNRIAIRTPMMAITTKSSTNEKPFRLDVSIKSPFFTLRAARRAEWVRAWVAINRPVEANRCPATLNYADLSPDAKRRKPPDERQIPKDAGLMPSSVGQAGRRHAERCARVGGGLGIGPLSRMPVANGPRMRPDEPLGPRALEPL